MKILTNTLSTEELKSMPCEACGGRDPNCEGIFLSPRCHPGAAVFVSYLNAFHVLEVKCSKCKRIVITLKLQDACKQCGPTAFASAETAQ